MIYEATFSYEHESDADERIASREAVEAAMHALEHGDPASGKKGWLVWSVNAFPTDDESIMNCLDSWDIEVPGFALRDSDDAPRAEPCAICGATCYANYAILAEAEGMSGETKCWVFLCSEHAPESK